MSNVDAVGKSEHKAAKTAAKQESATRSTFVQRYAMLLFLALLVVLFCLLEPNTFATFDNARQLLNNQAVVIVIALAAMVTLVVGAFDLSIPATMSLGSVLAIGLQSMSNLPWPGAVAVAIVVGAFIGLINGCLVGVAKLGSFVVTLATSVVIGGITLWYTGGQVLFSNIQPSFLTAGRGTVFGLVYPLFLSLLLVAALAFVLEHTPLGRAMHATGNSPDAARLAGLPTTRLVILSFVAGGVLAALAGVIVAAKIGSGQPDVGASYLLPAFASAFLGSSTIRPGSFNSLGTAVGVYLVAVGFTGLVLLGVALWVQPVFYGLTLLIAISAPRLADIRQRHTLAKVAVAAAARADRSEADTA